MKKQKLTAIIAITFISIFSACKTTQKISGPANLTILIVDENDSPVRDFEINLLQNKKNDEKTVSEMTNNSGLCVFYDLLPDEYQLWGNKSGYTQLSAQSLMFNNVSELYCFKVYSAPSVLDQVEHLYENAQHQKALELLDLLCCNKNTPLQNTVLFYKAYGYASLGQKEKAGFQLQKLKESDNPAFETSRYCEAIEKMLSD